MRTTTLLLSAALLLAGIGSASACSISNVDVVVDGNGNVLEVEDNGYANQITGRVFGPYHKLSGRLGGDCNAVVVQQDGSFTRVGLVVDGDNQGIAVLVSNGAVVKIDSSGDGAQILIDAVGGNFTVHNIGDNDIRVSKGRRS